VTALVQEPAAEASVLSASAGPELAVQASEAFFEQAPVVVVAAAGDAGSELTGASLGVALGVPVLLAAADSPAGLLSDELERLGTETVLGLGEQVEPLLLGEPPESAGAAPDEAAGADEAAAAADADRGPDVDVVTVGAEAAALSDLFGRELTEGEPVAEGEQIAALAALTREDGLLLRLDGAPASPSASSPTPLSEREEPVLPVLAETAVLDGVTALSDGTPAQAAAVATARAAGATVLSVPGGDPRGSADAIAALSGDKPRAVLGLGGAFGSDETLAWRVATAATGTQLPGGGQLVFAGKRYSALYGTPGTAALGVLGEQGTEATIARAKQHAEALQPFTQDQVLPSLEIIASIATAGAGPDGDYSNTRPIAELRPLVEAAGEAGLYVVLDLQPGRTDFLTQARMYEELLRLPHVGLALDPEWRLKPGQVHLRQIGSVGIDEVNQVVTYLADLTRENRLPQKLFIIHQFRLSMVADRDRLDTSRSELAMMVHVDGQGSQPAKNDTWNVLRRNAPDVYWGWKNFYDEDRPMLNPQQTMQIEPLPHLVSYQ
jgi:hypothetical protein